MGATPTTGNFESTGPRGREIADFEPIFAHGASVNESVVVQCIGTDKLR